MNTMWVLTSVEPSPSHFPSSSGMKQRESPDLPSQSKRACHLPSLTKVTCTYQHRRVFLEFVAPCVQRAFFLRTTILSTSAAPIHQKLGCGMRVPLIHHADC